MNNRRLERHNRKVEKELQNSRVDLNKRVGLKKKLFLAGAVGAGLVASSSLVNASGLVLRSKGVDYQPENFITINTAGNTFVKLDQTIPQEYIGTFSFPDVRLTLSGTINRDVTTNLITSIVKTGGRTLTPTRDVNGFISSITDGTKTWSFTRNANNFIISWAVA